MLAIVLGMLIVLAAAGYVIYSVALPNVREGAQVLTPEGERLTRHARRRAREAAATARTRAVALRERLPGESGGSSGAEAADGPVPPQEAPAADSDVISRRVEAGVQARTGANPGPPRQQGSPLATPATGVSETLSG